MNGLDWWTMTTTRVRLLLLLFLLFLSADSCDALKRPLASLSLLDEEHKAVPVRVVGGLLEEHVSGTWETLDRGLVSEEEDAVSFSIQLRQCNLEVLKDLLEQQVANPKHPSYRAYWTSEQIDKFVSCGSPTEAAKRQIPKWLTDNGIDQHQIHVTNAYIHVHKATVRQIETLFPVQMRYHQHLATGKTLLRARGLLTMPKEISRHVLFITGLTELQLPVKAGVQVSNEFVGAPYFSSYQQDMPVTPKILRRQYNLRQNLTGGSASNNSFAIAAFNDFFYEDDLCYSVDLLGNDPLNQSLWFENPNAVSYNGPTTGGDNAESSLDVQFATLIASNVSISFWNHDEGQWILSWAQQAVNVTSSNGPWIWSVSYGWPEVAHCALARNVTDPTLCSSLGLDYQTYIELTNSELMKLALMGVTVFVSSGDDGAPGFSVNIFLDFHLNLFRDFSILFFRFIALLTHQSLSHSQTKNQFTLALRLIQMSVFAGLLF